MAANKEAARPFNPTTKMRIEITGQRNISSVLFHVMPEVIRRHNREELRRIARDKGVPRGRNKADTIQNLIASGHLRVFVECFVEKP